MKEKFDIEGLQCPTCAHRLQKKLLKLNGIHDATVNMASETIIIDYDEKVIDKKTIAQEIENLGYQLILPNLTNNYFGGCTSNKPKIEYYGRLTTISVILFIPLLVIGLGQNFILGFTNFIESRNLVSNNLLLQFILSTAILIVGLPILKNGFLMLFRLHANTDSLIALGATMSYIYSCIIGYRMLFIFDDYPSLLYFAASSAMIVFRILGYYIEKRISVRNKVNIMPFLKLVPDSVNVIKLRDPEEEPAEEVKTKFANPLINGNEYLKKEDILNLHIDDVMAVISGDRVAADGEIIRGTALINETIYSGSAGLKRVTSGDKILAGTLVSEGELCIRVNKIGKDTFLNSLITMLQEGENSKADINNFTDKVSSVTIRVILILAFVSSVLWYIAGEDFSFAISIFLSVLIIGCPVATGIAVPLSSLFAVKYGSKKGIIIRKINSIEVIRKSTAFVFNQTGTLTKGVPKVTDVILTGNYSRDRLLFFAASAESISLHPVATAIVAEAARLNIEMKAPEPFRYIQGEGIEANIDDTRVDIGNYKLMKLLRINEEEIDRAIHVYKRLTQDGKSAVFVVIENKIEGIIAMIDEIRPKAKDVIDFINSKDKETVLLTGDHWHTASLLSEKIDIHKTFAEVPVANRARTIRKIQYEDNIVVMVGDGINDAQAIVQADSGIVIGTPDTIAADVADVIIINNDLRLLQTLIKLADKTVRNIKENIFFIFIYNLFMLPIAMGFLYLLGTNIILDPILASAVMFLGVITVLINSFRLNYFK